MNLNRPDMTETVKSENYTNKFLQKDTNPTTMEVVTQTNAVKSPTENIGKQKLPGAKVTRLQGIGGLPMNMNRPDMTEDMKYKDYTNKPLQMDSNPVTMKA